MVTNYAQVCIVPVASVFNTVVSAAKSSESGPSISPARGVIREEADGTLTSSPPAKQTPPRPPLGRGEGGPRPQSWAQSLPCI